jgi:hypothetical protein
MRHWSNFWENILISFGWRFKSRDMTILRDISYKITKDVKGNWGSHSAISATWLLQVFYTPATTLGQLHTSAYIYKNATRWRRLHGSPHPILLNPPKRLWTFMFMHQLPQQGSSDTQVGCSHPNPGWSKRGMHGRQPVLIIGPRVCAPSKNSIGLATTCIHESRLIIYRLTSA